jgi:hypothetical protein
VIVVIGDRDQVEHEPALREAFAGFLLQATFRLLKGIGHLSPLEAPGTGGCLQRLPQGHLAELTRNGSMNGAKDDQKFGGH